MLILQCMIPGKLGELLGWGTELGGRLATAAAGTRGLGGLPRIAQTNLKVGLVLDHPFPPDVKRVFNQSAKPT